MKNIRIVVIFGLILSILTLFWGIEIGKLNHDILYRANQNTMEYKIELIHAYDDYYDACETLLDSLVLYTNFDSVLNVYYQYEVNKDRIGFLNHMEDSPLTWQDYYRFLEKYNLKPYQTNLKD